MSIWTRIGDALSALTSGEPLSVVFDRLRTPPERSVAFAIAVIGLGAKMAKADGLVTRDEVTAFREVFFIPQGEEANAARVFNLARQDVAGFEEYARRIARMFGDRDPVLADLMEGLFHIAVADGSYHVAENDFLARVAGIFGLDEARFRGIRTRFVPDAAPDPWDVLGIPPGTPVEEARAAWRQLVRESHPDRMIARGVPEEAVKLAERRLVAINRAWEEISGKAA
jgi:DnaJ like chaperone protein